MGVFIDFYLVITDSIRTMFISCLYAWSYNAAIIVARQFGNSSGS